MNPEIGEEQIEALEQDDGFLAGVAEFCEIGDLLGEVVVEVEEFLTGLEPLLEPIAVVVELGVVVGGEVVETGGGGFVPEQQMGLVAGADFPEAGEGLGVGVGAGEEHG